MFGCCKFYYSKTLVFANFDIPQHLSYGRVHVLDRVLTELRRVSMCSVHELSSRRLMRRMAFLDGTTKTASSTLPGLSCPGTTGYHRSCPRRCWATSRRYN